MLTFSWGLNGVAAKLANAGFNPIFLTLARSAIGGVLVFLWCRYRGIRLFDRDGTLPAGLLAGFLFGAEFTLHFRRARIHDGRAQRADGQHHAVLGAGRRAFPARRAHVARQVRRASRWPSAASCWCFPTSSACPDPSAIIGDVLSICGGIFWAATTLVIKTIAARHGKCGKAAALPACASPP